VDAWRREPHRERGYGHKVERGADVGARPPTRFPFRCWVTNNVRIDDPPRYYFTVLGGFLGIRRFILRHLSPPRPEWLRMRFITDDQSPDPETGKYHVLHWNDYPWYVKPTFWNRWGPGAILTRLAGGVVPGDAAYIPGGYLASELGPDKLRGKGDAEMEKNRVELRDRTRRRIAAGGCPMPFH
jgi:hypothetical protein